jgi:MoaA/NifB/PqqE/SkfB family radical SAM enzyme
MGVRAVTFSGGGEPLCYPHLAQAASRLASAGIRLACLTNGSRLRGGIAATLAEHATWIRVSIDGWDAASYAEYRGVPETAFADLQRNLADFKRRGARCCLGAVFIVDARNCGKVLEMIRRLSDLGLDSVKVSPCIVSNDCGENNAYHAPHFQQVKEQVMRAREETRRAGFELFDAYHQLGSFAKSYTWCPSIQLNPVIGADLNVYSCQDKAYNLDCGLICSVRDQRFADAWRADKRQFFVINPSVDCRHQCVAHPKNELVMEYLDADPEHLPFL